MAIILILETDAGVQQEYRKLLAEKCGYEVLFVPTAREAKCDLALRADRQTGRSGVDMVILGNSSEQHLYSELADHIKKTYWFREEHRRPVLVDTNRRNDVSSFLLYSREDLLERLRKEDPGFTVVCEALMNNGVDVTHSSRLREPERHQGWLRGLVRKGAALFSCVPGRGA